ncbi:hypothetical protein AHAS_Ahas17G0117500 [Arachis hypogaea]
MKGQADIIGIAMRRVLLGEIEGTCITRAKFEKIPHEYSTIVGIQESVPPRSLARDCEYRVSTISPLRHLESESYSMNMISS